MAILAVELEQTRRSKNDPNRNPQLMIWIPANLVGKPSDKPEAADRGTNRCDLNIG